VTASLPVHSSSDIHLADAFGMPGCPLCRERRRTEAAFLEAILAESVNDVGFRADLDAARGFCASHSRAILDVDRRRAGSLGAAILLRAMLRVRLAEWRGLRDRATGIELLPDGVRVELPADEPLAELARLVSAESECCGFYRFTIEVTGATRRLNVDAGAGGGARRVRAAAAARCEQPAGEADHGEGGPHGTVQHHGVQRRKRTSAACEARVMLRRTVRRVAWGRGMRDCPDGRA